MVSSAGAPVVFCESRESLRVEADELGIVGNVWSHLRGAAARTPNGWPSLRFLTDPRSGDVAAMVEEGGVSDRRSAFPGDGDSDPRQLVLDPRIAATRIERLIHAAPSASSGARMSYRVRWIESLQTVRVSVGGDPVRSDLRRARRIRIEARAERNAAIAIAVHEGAFRDDRFQDLALRGLHGAVARAVERLDSTSPPAGEFPVVFQAGAGGVLIHELVGHALEGDVLTKSASYLSRVECAAASPGVTVIDDPRRGRCPWRIDDEGIESRPVALIRDGRVSGALLDDTSAGAMGSTPTGHGRCASFRDPVLPRMGCTFLAAGSLSPEEVIEGIDRGIFVRRLESASTNPITGRAVFRVMDADLVTAGRADRPLHPFLLAVDGLAALGSIERVASDLAFDSCIGACVRDGQTIATSVGAPTFCTRVAMVDPRNPRDV